jgi:hypothetical protein
MYEAGRWVGGQPIQLGLPHASKTAEVSVGSNTFQISVEDGPVVGRTMFRVQTHSGCLVCS